MKQTIGLSVLGVVALLAVANCGGGGGGGGGNAQPVTPPSQNLTGTYTLTGFQVIYSDNTTINENSITSWAGTMKIGTNTFSQSIVLDNIPISVSGSATIRWIVPNVEGIAQVTDTSGTYDVAFTISGMDLSTYSGVVMTGTPGLTFEEWDYWTKVSDSLSPVSESIRTEKADESAIKNKHWIGD